MRQALAGRGTRLAVRLTVFLIAVLSNGNFNRTLLGLGPADPSSDAPRQQIAILLLWFLLLALSVLPRALRSWPATKGLALPALFLAYVAVSPIWSGDQLEAAPKALVFAIVSIAVWRLAAMITFAEFMRLLYYALWLLLTVSLLLVLVRPDFAVSHDWQHPGDWMGIYDQKQNLGVAAAFFVYLAFMRLLDRPRLLDAAALVLGLLLLIESGSRGSAAIAVTGPIAIFAARRYPALYGAILGTILLEAVLANVIILYFAVTGADYIHVGSVSLDLTERSFIWNYAVTHWLARPMLGFGVNGFWTDPQIRWGFERVHGWVLEDYHSGYIAVMAETGLVGMTMFLIILTRFCQRIWNVLRTHSTAAGLLVGFVFMLSTIDLTETIFLRSTNFGQVAFTFFLVKVLSQPARQGLALRRPMRAAAAIGD